MAQNQHHNDYALGVKTVADDIQSRNTVASNNDNSVNTATTVGVEDAFKDQSDNSYTDNSSFTATATDKSTDTDVAVGIEDSFNDESVNTSVEDSFKDQSDNSVNTSVEDSFKDQSDNSVNTSIEDSFKDQSDHSVSNQDSFNITSSFNSQTLHDHSTTIGVRQYNAGMGDLNIEGALGAAGVKSGGAAGGLDLDIDARTLQFDQSVNQAVSTGDGGAVNQAFGQSATVAFGDGSVAAGGDVAIDNSETTVSLGDVNVGNTAIETKVNDSFNDFSENLDLDLDVADSFNDNSQYSAVDVDVEDSFTSEIDSTFDNSWEWENQGNLFSPGGATSGGATDIDF